MEILELAFQDGLNPKKVAATNGGEYHSPCPGSYPSTYLVKNNFNQNF